MTPPSSSTPTFVAIPQRFHDILHSTALAHLVTLMPDGSPQVSPMWFEFDGRDLILNSSRGRVKDTNMRRDPRVALSIVHPDKPYHYVQIRGRVTDISEVDALAGVNRLAQKYLGVDVYPDLRPDEIRVSYRIRPEHVSGLG